MKRLKLRIRSVMRKAARRWAVIRGRGVSSALSLDDRGFLALFDDVAAGRRPVAPVQEKIDRLLRHYAGRASEGWPALPKKLTDLRLDLSMMDDSAIVSRAEAALDHDLHPSGVRPLLCEDGMIDWSENPADSREWLLMLHRHAWWPLWARAYQLTGDAKYAQAFERQITDWIRRNPMPPLKSEQHAPWRLMECGLRLRLSWIPSLGCFLQAGVLSDVSILLVLRSIYDHCNFLRHFFTNRNHLVRESNGLLAAACLFHEFREAEDWRLTAISRLDREVTDQVNEDGSHIEMSVGYQWLAVDEFEVTRELLQLHGGSLPSVDLERTLERMYEYLAALIRPDRKFPQLNDGFILWDAERLADAGRRLDRSDIVYAASSGDDGVAPGWTSRFFPNAGLHVMRSGWTPDASYLVFDTGPYGGPHGHEDKLSFELFAKGAPLIVDPGSYTYQPDDPFRKYFVGSYGHNTVLVDGKSQVRRWQSAHLNPRVDPSTHGHWRSDDAYDRALGRYDEGYADYALAADTDAGPIMDVTHIRKIVFVKPDYWIVADLLMSREDHDYTTLFHLAPDVVPETNSDTAAVCACKRTGARLLLAGAANTRLRSEIINGRERPPQGWYSPDHHKKLPAAVLEFTMRGRGRSLVAWLVVPFAGEAGATAPAVEVGSGHEDGSGLRFSVSLPRSAGGRCDEVAIAVGEADAPEIRVKRGHGPKGSAGR